MQGTIWCGRWSRQSTVHPSFVRVHRETAKHVEVMRQIAEWDLSWQQWPLIAVMSYRVQVWTTWMYRSSVDVHKDVNMTYKLLSDWNSQIERDCCVQNWAPYPDVVWRAQWRICSQILAHKLQTERHRQEDRMTLPGQIQWFSFSLLAGGVCMQGIQTHLFCSWLWIDNSFVLWLDQ